MPYTYIHKHAHILPSLIITICVRVRTNIVVLLFSLCENSNDEVTKTLFLKIFKKIHDINNLVENN